MWTGYSLCKIGSRVQWSSFMDRMMNMRVSYVEGVSSSVLNANWPRIFCTVELSSYLNIFVFDPKHCHCMQVLSLRGLNPWTSAISVISQFKLIFKKCWIQLLAWSLALLIKMFRGFPHSRQPNAGIVSRIFYGHFLPYPFQIIIHLSPQHCEVRVLVCLATGP
jgi:hypothetical protein